MVTAKKAQGLTTCAVDVFPSPVDAGADITLIGTVSSSPPTDMVGKILSIKDHDGNEVGTVDLVEYHGETNLTGPIVVKAPTKVGEYTWTVVCPRHDDDDASYEEVSAPFSVTVKAHATSVVAWDVPFAVAANDRLRIKVGVKCSSQCQLAGLPFQINDHQGNTIAAGLLGGEPAPGTTALYFGEAELKAIEKVGVYSWTAKALAADIVTGNSEVALSHSEGAATFLLKVVDPADHTVTVRVIDGEEQTPFKGAQVVMDPYRTVTDDRGVAEVRVAKGEYTLYVSGPSYQRFERRLEVTRDMSTTAVLYLRPPPEND